MKWIDIGDCLINFEKILLVKKIDKEVDGDEGYYIKYCFNVDICITSSFPNVNIRDEEFLKLQSILNQSFNDKDHMAAPDKNGQ